ncbi:hypothetical protein Cgig2_012345 [Carnegiea gigantea]|uniref:DUF4283 domain-containing protein n=1 Tax=Carnegiea gigantea TaxID=171969 RepID=A0A9Q1JQK2_9CARY|nr:hypothetical protein Cgig2_012345 [Carnegiea gigantea]
MRGGRRGRPKQSQPGVSPSQSHLSHEEEVDAEPIADHSTPFSAPSGNGTVPLSSSLAVATAPNRGTVFPYAALVNPDEVRGANPPIEVMDGYLRRVWKSLGVDKICLVRKGLYIVCFNSLAGQWTVVQKEVYYFNNKPLLAKPWNHEMDINTEAITSLPIWVRLLDLNIRY